MSDPATAPLDPDTADAKARIEIIAMLFDELAASIEVAISELGPVSLAKTKTAVAKLSEMQSAHLLVLKSQEAFHDKYDQDFGGDAAAIDYDVIRDEIGRALDRIRDADGAERVSQRPD